MDPVRNPFAPGAGTPPPAFAGREELLEKARIALLRVREGRAAKSLLLIGLRGVGKTVLLNRIHELAEAEGYRALLIETTEGMDIGQLLLPPLRRVLLALDRLEGANEQVRRGFRVFRSFAKSLKVKVGDIEVSLGIEEERGVADTGSLEADLPDLLVAVAQAGAARKTPIALIVDELQYLPEEELSALILSMHKIAQKQLPLILFGAGLPQLVGQSGKSKSYAERLFEFSEVGPLSRLHATAALDQPVRREGVYFTSEALDAIADITLGYPYFLQEWGYHVWNAATASPITAAMVQAAEPATIRSLDESFFRVRFDRLTPREKDYLRGMAELGPGPHRSGDVAEALGVAVASVAPVRSSLIKKGMIYSPAHGDTAFTVPLFDAYLKRTMPLREPRKPATPKSTGG
jgi:AAA ATPase domain